MPLGEPKERQIPLALLGAGFLLCFVAAWRLATPAHGFAEMVGPLFARLGLQTALLFVGALVTAKLINVSFGAVGSAILKLAAIALFPGALAAAINIAFVSWAVAILLYLFLLAYLFDLDLREALIFAGVMIVIRIVAIYAMAMASA